MQQFFFIYKTAAPTRPTTAIATCCIPANAVGRPPLAVTLPVSVGVEVDSTLVGPTLVVSVTLVVVNGGRVVVVVEIGWMEITGMVERVTPLEGMSVLCYSD